MKSPSILGQSTVLALLVTLGSPGACAESEIAPDYDSPSAESLDQPKTQSQAHATRYHGNFSLPYAVQCSGKKLAPGEYSVSLRSDGEVGHGILKLKSQSMESTSAVHPQGSKRGAEVVVVGSNGKVRTLSANQVAGVNFVFYRIFKADASSSSKNESVETLPLTVSFKRSQNLGSP
jgi:hypothetical protein